MTVGELKKFLEEEDDDTEVIIRDCEGCMRVTRLFVESRRNIDGSMVKAVILEATW
jgi:hypothetical protein